MPTGILYVVSTPIGNLQDLTPRAAKILHEVDFIAAEDTRVTVKLLNHLGIKNQMISYHKYNQDEKGDQILSRIENGENCALCSDAGMPAISDPGEELVTEAINRGIRVVPIPAASAALTALCVSGQNTSRFVFEGFLPVNSRRRQKHLQLLKDETRTIILYEAPHKLLRTLKDLITVFPAEHSITLCRELTKIHEEVEKTTLSAALAKYSEKDPRGEFVLVLSGALETAVQEEEVSLEDAVEFALDLAETEGLSASACAKKAAEYSGLPKNVIYRAMQGAAK